MISSKSYLKKIKLGLFSTAMITAFIQSANACEDRIFIDGFETRFQIQVDVIGLGNNVAGRSLELQLNNNETLNLTTDGTSSFCALLPTGSNYQVSINTQPQTGNSCRLSNNTGALNANTTVIATCGDSRWDEMNWDTDDWN